MSDDLDSILEALKGPSAAAPGAIDPMAMMMMQMQNDRADRAASRQMMLQLITGIAPLILPMLMQKKEADPIMMTLLSSLLGKKDDGEQLKSMLQMMAAGNQMTMEQMKSSLLSIMEMKDQQTKKLLEEASERGDDGPASGPAAIMREIRLGLGAAINLLPQQPQQPAQVASVPNLMHTTMDKVSCKRCGTAYVDGRQACKCADAQAPAQRPPPIAVVLAQLQAIQTGKVKESPATWAALSTVALQDDALLAALDDCAEDDLQPLFAYCLPHLKASQTLMAWVSAEGVPAWIDDRVKRKLLPLIDAARDDGEEEAEEDPAEPAAVPAGMHPMPVAADLSHEPETLHAGNTEG